MPSATVIESLTDDELIARIEATEPLPAAAIGDPVWNEDAIWDGAEFLHAAAYAIGERRLLRAIAPLCQRAALGDAYGMMQALRHGPERAAAPDWNFVIRPGAALALRHTALSDPRSRAKSTALS